MIVEISNVKIDTDKITNDEREALRTALEPKEWPQKMDNYWCANSLGEVFDIAWYGCSKDQFRLAVGNRFKTEEEAKAKIEHDKVCEELRRMADWDSRKRSKEWCYHLRHESAERVLPDYFSSPISPYSFASEESCQKAIDTIGEERLIKYYFNYGRDT